MHPIGGWAGAFVALLAGSSWAAPHQQHHPHPHLHLEARTDVGVSLRIMPLGDSITWGSLSSTGNGYRGPLRELLSGGDVDFVGSRKNGNMADNDNEGHSGSFLGEIKDYALLSVAARPNVVLLHAGTNDMDLQREVSTAPDRLAAIIDLVLEKCPDATVLVAQIIFSTDPDMQGRTDTYNAAIANLVKERQDDGKHVLAVDMSGILSTTDLADKKHPNDSGYAKMASAWYNGIVAAKEKKWISAPKESNAGGVGLGTGSGSGEVCTGSNWIKKGTVADLIRIWNPQGQVAPGVADSTRDNLHFADIDGDGKDDYLVVYNDGAVRAWRNNGNIPDSGQGRNWVELGAIATGVGEEGSKVRFADIDGDGLDDYLIVYNGGAVKAWRNTGNILSGDGRKWEELGTIATGVGEDGSKVRFGDVDGDGLADYLVLYDGGAVKAWRNTGNLNKGDGRNFEEMGTIATGISGVPGSKVRLEDFDGDGLVDYLVLYDGGAMEGYRNTGNLGKGEGRNFEDMGVIAGGVGGVTGEMVRFGDLNGDGKVDYLSVSEAGAVSAWINTGKVGKGSGIRFADLNGDGRDDLLYVDDKGAVDAWLNAGSNPQRWTSLGQVATGVQDATLDKVFFADLDGDRLDDYILLYDGGAAKGWRNTGNLNKGEGRNWDELGVIATGVGAPGSKVRFADVNGDRIADYLVVWDGGAVDAYIGTGNVLNDGRNFNGIGTIAGGVGAPGSKVRFADIDGDGLDDYLVSWDGGAVEAWRNNGNLEKQPELPSWEKLGVIAAGVQDQGRVILADIDGDGKADYLNIDLDSGTVGAYVNQCAGSNNGGGDNGGGDSGGDGDTSGGGGGDPDGGDGGVFIPIDFCTGGGVVTAETWQNESTDAYFSKWWDDNGSQSNFAVNFGYEWGLGQTFRCSLPNTCEAPLCRDLEPQNDDTGKGWLVLESLANLNQYIMKLREALFLSNTQYATLQVAIEKDFDPGSSARDIAGQEALSAMVAIIGIATAWLGPLKVIDPNLTPGAIAAYGSFKEVFAGASRSITATLQASDISLANIAEEAEYVHSFFGVNLMELEDMNVNLMGRGKHKSYKDNQEADIKDILAAGYFADYRQIPTLNTDLDYPIVSQQAVSNWLFKVVLGNLVSSIWKKQGVWITSIPMTEKECQDNEPGNGDHRLKLCKDGKGYFLQRITNKKSALGFDDWTTTLPQFWGEMEEKYGITPQDAIESSVEAYKSGGFDFKSDSLIGNILDVRGEQNMKAFTRFPGIWTLPVCDLEIVFKTRDLDLEGYMEYIEKPGFSYNDDVGTGTACFCGFSTDKNDKTFREYYVFDPKC